MIIIHELKKFKYIHCEVVLDQPLPEDGWGRLIGKGSERRAGMTSSLPPPSPSLSLQSPSMPPTRHSLPSLDFAFKSGMNKLGDALQAVDEFLDTLEPRLRKLDSSVAKLKQAAEVHKDEAAQHKNSLVELKEQLNQEVTHKERLEDEVRTLRCQVEALVIEQHRGKARRGRSSSPAIRPKQDKNAAPATAT